MFILLYALETVKKLAITDFLENSAGPSERFILAKNCIIDVRSEGEFLKGHIANAINIPLFNNEERAKVGTTYKQVGKDEAIIQGLEIVGPKMAAIVKKVKEQMLKQETKVSQDDKLHREVFVYCWRGGMRSGSVGWLLETSGFTVYLLEGGYKSYRNKVNNFLETMQLQLKVLSGCTGSGKTEILQLLEKSGEQIIDLEQLAHHKGSAFGGLGQQEAPSQEDFDNRLFTELQKMDLNKPIWIEDESKNIGRIYLPLNLLALIQTNPVYFVNVSQQDRIERLIKEYAIHDKTDLGICLEKIRKRLGGQAFKDCAQALDENNFKYFTELVLFYYDRTYIKHLNQKKDRIVKEVEVKNQDYELAIEKLLEVT